MSNIAPNVYVQETTFSSFNTPSTPVGSFVFVGAHNRGPVGLSPTQVTSWNAFTAQFGGFTGVSTPSNLAFAVYSFFNNGGGQCSVIRVVHSDAVAAAGTLNSTAIVGTTPAVGTLTVTAANPGAWGNNITVIVTAGAIAGRFNLAVYYGGGANPTSANLAEPVWQNLSMSSGDSYYAPNIVNNPLSGSTFIRLTDLAAAGTTGGVPLPATTPLGSGIGSVIGVDGSAVTATDLTATNVTNTLNQIHNPITLNFPGVTDQTNVLNPMISYCTTGRSFADSVLVCDTPSGQTPAGAISYAAGLTPSSYAAVYYPWVTVADPSSSNTTALRTLPPGAFAMAIMAQTDARRGVQKAPAGYATHINAIAPESYLIDADIGNLTAANINCIKVLAGSGVVIWGARTLSNVLTTRFLNVRRTLIFIEAQVQALSQYAVFEDNDWVLWNQLTNRLTDFLSKFWSGGGLAGTTRNKAFFVICDASNNNYNASTVNIQVGVAVASPAEIVLITIGQWQGGSSVTETTTATIGG